MRVFNFSLSISIATMCWPPLGELGLPSLRGDGSAIGGGDMGRATGVVDERTQPPSTVLAAGWRGDRLPRPPPPLPPPSIRFHHHHRFSTATTVESFESIENFWTLTFCVNLRKSINTDAIYKISHSVPRRRRERMSDIIRQNKSFLALLCSTKNSEQRQALLDSATPSQVRALSEVVLNLYCKRIHPPHNKSQLKEHEFELSRLAAANRLF